MIELRPWHRVALDAAAILLLAVLAADGDGQPGLIVPLFLVLAPVLWRRRYPVPVLIWTNAITYLFVLRLEPGLLPAAWMMASYSAAVRSERAAVLTGAGTWPLAQLIVLHQGGMTPLQRVVVPVIVALSPCVVAYAVLRRRAWRAAFADQLRRRAEAEAEARIAADRLTIARELHDVIAHGLTLMTVQAGVARLRSASDDPLHEVVGTIEQTGRSSLTEMRRLMNLLCGDDADGLAPPPGLSDVGDLVAAASAAGLPTELAVDGAPRGLPCRRRPGRLQDHAGSPDQRRQARLHRIGRRHHHPRDRRSPRARVQFRCDRFSGGGARHLRDERPSPSLRRHGECRTRPPDGWQVEAWIPYPAEHTAHRAAECTADEAAECTAEPSEDRP